ncbi:MAG: VOC family protein [Pseudomonadota bacterium]
MAHVVGIGGIFFRADNPDALSQWYSDMLDIAGEHGMWQQESGPTVFAPFEADTGYFGNPDQQWMLNLRVRDIDGLIAKLKAADVEVETREDWDSEIGRFARIHDPEGNPVELWEPGDAG